MKSTFKVLILLLPLFLTQQLKAQSSIWDKIDRKANWFLSGNIVLTDPEAITDDFKAFYNQFISDSTYQIEHIKLPLTGAIGFCESTKELTEANWEIIEHHYSRSFDDSRYTHSIVSTDSLFFLRSTLNEVGVISQIGFEKIDGIWYLTLFMINAC